MQLLVPALDEVPEATFSISVLLPVPGAGMLVGVKVAVTPAESPVNERAIANLNPLTGAVVTAIAIEPPCFMDTLTPASIIVKLGATT